MLDRAIAGDGAALQQLLIPYQSRLLARLTKRLPLSLRSSISAEDLLQETFVEIFRQIRGFEPQGRAAFVRWLIMVADGRLIQAIRRHSALKRGGARPALDAMAGGSSDVPLFELLDVDTHSPSRSVAGHEIEAAVQAALLRIKPEYRDAVRMRYIEGLSVAEVAQRMGKTDWSVHKLCTRGFAAMRAALGEEVRFLSKS
ncbi:MAG: RNA polymerase sigma factor [Phycisphaerae bacterium]